MATDETNHERPSSQSDSAAKSPVPDLNIERLHSLPTEQQDLYLLTYTSELVRYVLSLETELLNKQQGGLRTEILKVINLSSPTPTRVIRNNIGACFAEIFSRGSRKILFETVNELVTICNAGKDEKSQKNKHAAIHCLGSIFEVAGDSAVSLCPLVCTTVLKQLKAFQNYTGIRASIVRLLGQITKGLGKSVDFAIASDIFKQVRSLAANDKSVLLQRYAIWTLEQLVTCAAHFDDSSDFDKLQQTIWKAMDSHSPSVRRAASSCLSTVFAKFYSATPIIMQPKKKAKQKPNTEIDPEEAAARPDSPAVPSRALSFTLAEILKVLSVQYIKASTNRVRGAIAGTYCGVLRALGEEVVQEQYATIANHLLVDLLCTPSIMWNRHRLLITRKIVHLILTEVVGRDMLSEGAQVIALRYLVNSVLKDWPQPESKDRKEPQKETLVGALDAMDSLMQLLGSAINPVAELCRGAFIQVLEHPSHTVQMWTAKCLQTFISQCPQQLLPCATICLNNVTREVNQLAGPRRSPRKCLGFAQGLAAIISASSAHPLYGSTEVFARVFHQATTTLKSSSGADLRVSSTQIRVAWLLIGSLMSLGPNFVKVHISQILLLWRNALPMPLKDDNIGKRGFLEISFLAHVRECALDAMRTFLEYNSRLLTMDVSKRLANMLQNTVEFLNNLPDRKTTDDPEKRLSPGLQLRDYDWMVRRRVFDCFLQLLKLSPHSTHDTLLQANLLTFAVTSFADPDGASSTSLSTSIAASAANFESIWDVADNSGFGITSLVNGTFVRPALDVAIGSELRWFALNGFDDKVDRTIHRPICCSAEHDPLILYLSDNEKDCPPLGTAVVDFAIRLFAVSLPLHSSRVQQGALEQLSSLLSHDTTGRNLARDMAVGVNVITSLLLTLQTATDSSSRYAGELKSANVEKALQELLHGFLKSSDEATRFLAAESIGALCKNFGNDFTTKEVSYLIEVIVADRDPGVRSACAMALGCIMTDLGGMAAGLHMKNILGVLNSLASDAHPTVHYWAIEALSKVADSVGLGFSSHVSGTLGTLAQLYVAESHGEETVQVQFSNIEVDRPTVAVLARCINSMVNVCGPDLQDLAKLRSMILTLNFQFQREQSPSAIAESMKSTENLLMYAPEHVSFAPYIRQLELRIDSDDQDIKETALIRLHNVMRRGAEDVIKSRGSKLEEKIWLVLNQAYGQGVCRKIVIDWVQQSGLQNLEQWTARIQRLLTRARPPRTHIRSVSKPQQSVAAESAAEPDLRDEDIAGFVASAPQTAKGDNAASSESQELLRWRVRAVAMDCLDRILSSVDEDSTELDTLQPQVADIIKIAFAASTASVIELRVSGIRIIGRILNLFGRVPDPDFPEATLLEQYQAQISSALTPAFATDSSPVLAAEAIGVCASFISAGIVSQVERMGRILKLLTVSMEEFSKNPEASAIGDLKGLSTNASTMVRLAVFSAWAQLQVASQEQKYLEDVLRPYLKRLTPLWLTSLREYAQLKFEPDISSAAAAISNDPNNLYAALNRETLLQFYQASWLSFVEAISNLIDEDSAFVFDALDEKSQNGEANSEEGNAPSKGHDINYRDEPVAFFFVLFGITFEALASRPSQTSALSHKRTLDLLQVLRKILRPSVAGLAIYQDATFSEALDLFGRLALTETVEIQATVVQIAQDLCNSHPAARRSSSDTPEAKLSDDIDQLFELTRLIVLVIAKYIPNLADASIQVRTEFSPPVVQLIKLGLTALVSASQVFPSVIQSDLHACVFHTFTIILATGRCQESLLPQTLPILRTFVSDLSGASTKPSPQTQSLVRTALFRFLSILRYAQRRESEAAVPCERNTLLAGTILLTNAFAAFEPQDELVRRWIDVVADCMGNSLTTKVAANASRLLLLLSLQKGSDKTGSASAMSISAAMLPHMLLFLTQPSELEGTDAARSVVSQALVAFTQGLDEGSPQVSALHVILPAFLERAQAEGEVVWKESNTRLLELASIDQDAFKRVILALPEELKTLLQEIIRHEGGVGQKSKSTRVRRVGTGSVDNQEPSIALKMDF